MARRRRRSNPPMLLPLLAVGAVVVYFALRKGSGDTRGQVKVTNPDGTTTVVPAWFQRAATVVDKAGKTVAEVEHAQPVVFNDENQYGGFFVGPPAPSDN